jgi:hypothetical protein
MGKKNGKDRMDQYPRDLQGPAQNRFGGLQTQRIRGFRGNTYGAAGPVKIYTAEQIRRYEIERGLR